jgi:hypothetical protein
MKATTTNNIRRHEADMIRRAERAQRAANDPWFGRRRSAGEMGRSKSKAARSKAACRGKGWV